MVPYVLSLPGAVLAFSDDFFIGANIVPTWRNVLPWRFIASIEDTAIWQVYGNLCLYEAGVTGFG